MSAANQKSFRKVGGRGMKIIKKQREKDRDKKENNNINQQYIDIIRFYTNYYN